MQLNKPQIWEATRPYVQTVYDELLREHLPRTFGIYAGVPARDARLLDATKRKPDYKRGLLKAINEEITDGDKVTLIGGGRGVSSVHIIEAGADHLIAYEAAAEMLAIAQETVEIAGGEDSVTFREALVGPAIEVYGAYDDADRIAPSDFDPNEVLVMDCEGAEVGILENLTTWPETIIVETHPERDTDPKVVRDRLLEQGCEVRSLPYEPEARSDKVVLVGTNHLAD